MQPVCFRSCFAISCSELIRESRTRTGKSGTCRPRGPTPSFPRWVPLWALPMWGDGAGQSSWINVHPLFIHPGLTLSLASCSPRLTPPLSRCSPWVNTSAQQVFTLSQHLRSAAVHPSQSALSHSQAAAAIQNWSTYDPTHTPRSATMPPLTPPP